MTSEIGETTGGIDMVDAIIRYETGNLSTEETVQMFAYLIRTGTAWRLQGSYGRAAHQMIVDGVISRDGEIDYERLGELNDQ
ncbi:hypothetical protein UFOVP570_17 [uncultured Caudovirales phage]|uniref:DUF7417 domain-containing protein n=1 Tax=uncultured Caudovirales phage TaxID=2100421 RepID=A0A6J5MWC9_9CAUD|nr:hypothetical protein UFOVP570_17 [uncultured Caudovirales phage]